MARQLRLPRHFTALAPMEGVTDAVFRRVIARAGRPDLFFTEFTNVSAFASEQGRASALARLRITPADPPIIAQIWGQNPEHLAQLASVLEGLGFAGLDLNMGCPDRNVCRHGGGAALIRTPELAIECIRRAQENTGLPVSVKTRLGYAQTAEFRAWLPLLLRQNLHLLTVHLRTKKEMSKVPAHFELIPEILVLRDRLAPATKLMINGDIPDLAAAERLWAKFPEIDGVMIGRGALKNPYCFTRHQPSREELLALFRYHLDVFDGENAENPGKNADFDAKTGRFAVFGKNSTPVTPSGKRAFLSKKPGRKNPEMPLQAPTGPAGGLFRRRAVGEPFSPNSAEKASPEPAAKNTALGTPQNRQIPVKIPENKQKTEVFFENSPKNGKKARKKAKTADSEPKSLPRKSAPVPKASKNTPPRRFEPLKHFFKVYLHDFAGASELRAELYQCQSTAEVRKILAEFNENKRPKPRS